MKAEKKFRVALIGSDSLRGKEIMRVLSSKRFPLTSIEFYDSDVEEEYSKLTQFQDEPKVVHHLAPDSLEGLDLVFLASDKKTNRQVGNLTRRQNFQAIDLSETYADQDDAPVVVAGVNDEVIKNKRFPLIANPHPVTIILSRLFHLLIPELGISKAIVFVLQPVSAFDESGIEELAGQSAALLSSSPLSKKVFKEQIAFNLLSQMERPDENGFSAGERQIVSEIRRVLQRPEFPISLSVIQAPVFHTYSIMAYTELEKEADINGLEKLFGLSSFFKVSSPSRPCPVSSITVAGKEKIFIGQIKKEEAFARSFWIWAVADNLTLGSALNALDIAKILFSASPNKSSKT